MTMNTIDTAVKALRKSQTLHLRALNKLNGHTAATEKARLFHLGEVAAIERALDDLLARRAYIEEALRGCRECGHSVSRHGMITGCDECFCALLGTRRQTTLPKPLDRVFA
jgi:hypothetical protein